MTLGERVGRLEIGADTTKIRTQGFHAPAAISLCWLTFLFASGLPALVFPQFLKPAGTKGFARAFILRAAPLFCACESRAPGLRQKDQEGRTMDRQNLPKHIVEKVERRWAQKLQEQVLAWKSSRSEARDATATGVPVVRRGKRKRRPQSNAAA